MHYLIFILGLIVLVVAGEILVKGAVNISYKLKISPLVVGMTIVSIGTSAPELIVSLKAAINNNPDIAIGNVIGSNIANIALILGLISIITPINVDVNSIKIDWPFMMGFSILFYLFSLNNAISVIEGGVLLALLCGFIYFLIWNSRKNYSTNEYVPPVKNLFLNILYVIIGCVGLMFGAEWLINGAKAIAKEFGVSDLVIATTIVAFGTSVPELATSLIAALRKQSDISIGNLIGSNIFNIGAILGITSLIKPIQVAQKAITNDMFWMLGIALILFPMMIYNRKILRIFGAILLASYCFYVFLVLTP